MGVGRLSCPRHSAHTCVSWGREMGEEWGATVPLYGRRWRCRSAPLLRGSVSIVPREGKRSYRERTCALGKSVLVTLHR